MPAAAEPAQVQKETGAEIIRSLSGEEVGPGAEWSIIALARSPLAKEPEAVALFTKYQENLRVQIKRAQGVLSKEQPTDNAKAAVALKMTGKDPADFEGYDLLDQLEDVEAVQGQGVNAEIWALIAAGCCERELSCSDRYVEDVLKMQLENGSFSFDGTTADVDITAMAVQALQVNGGGDEASSEEAPDAAADAVQRAMDWLSSVQGSDGGFGNTESTAQVIIAAGYSGEAVASMAAFTKADKTLVDGLMQYRLEEGFRHKDEDSVDAMATEQAMCAIDAIVLSEEGEPLF